MNRLPVLAALLLLGCASPPAEPEEPPPPAAETTTAALVQRLLGEGPPARVEAAERLVAKGPEAAAEVHGALDGADDEGRRRLLAVLEAMNAWPPEIGPEARLDVLLWRLRGERGGLSDRTRALASLGELPAGVRRALARRAAASGADRALALYALSRSGDPSARRVLVDALRADDARVRSAAAAGLEHLAERTEPDRAEAGTTGGRQG